MRLVALAFSAAALFSADVASAQVPGQSGRPEGGRSPGGQQEEQSRQDRTPRIAPLRRRAADGPCPYVKILYDAARYVELGGDRVSASNVGYTGEIEGLVSDCAYRGDDPITLQTRVLFNLGRGPLAEGNGRTYRYWIAVTERNRAVLDKVYFDLPVTFEGDERTTTVTQDQTIVIPRASNTVSGDNFEILVGFEVTPEMAEFNRSGSRFRINAGAQAD
ncbi:MAG: Tat pathway signal sequence domain protein [Brevundimonas sp.]|jgi:hypothetical protein|uniref:Tat pathway signal sequence domain protein n=1 Tax=Brevundimonas sp. TaxID=1871086 RepID=UPI0017932526|nr:Tat pathway signal sequence domain protein [Brevundimonas sp.]MBA4803998.1 Tat pathway signal sequence domain protein [Brevundimonas sp.]